jgi:molecular chaperone GrpE (heat shock protein)
MSDSDSKTGDASFEEAGPQTPTVDPEEFEALRVRAEGAERKLREIQQTFVLAKAELDATRARLERDLERKVEIKFADLVADLLDCADDLDRAIEHGGTIPAAASVIRGVALARERFLAALQKAGLERIEPIGELYDPNVAEAVGIVPAADPAEHDTVLQLARVGYKLSGRVIRPARVLIGRLVS